MRLAIRSAAAKLGPCLSISHLLGPPGTVLHVAAGHPDPVQDRPGEPKRPGAGSGVPEVNPSTVDVVVAGNDPWPGDPMMSFKVLLQHRAAGRPGGVLAGFFWTDPESDRPLSAQCTRAERDRGNREPSGGWMIRQGLASRLTGWSPTLHAPNEFLIRWARELVVDRTVLVYAPPLFDKIGPLARPDPRLQRSSQALARPPRSPCQGSPILAAGSSPKAV